MKFKSMVYSAASGSIGGVTYSHNRFGMYTRAKAIPVNPNTALQQLARSRLASVAALWGTLSAAIRDGWAAWAATVLKVNSMGDAVALTGFNWFVGINAQRLQAGQSILQSPAGVLALGVASPMTFTITAAADNVVLAFTNSDLWATAVGGFANVFASLAQPASRNFIAGPFRKIGTINGAVSPPTSPATNPVGSNILVGQKVWVRVITQTADGRPSSAQLLSAIAT